MDFEHTPHSRTHWFSNQLMEACGATSKDYVFVETFGMGDHINTMRVVGGIADELKKNGGKIIFWVSQRNLLLKNYFEGVFDHVVCPTHPHGQMVDWGHLDYQVNCLAEKNIRRVGRPLIFAFDSIYDGLLGKLFRADKITLTDIKRILLNLPFDSPLCPLTVPKEKKLEHIENAKKQGLVPGSIILFNHQWGKNGFDENLFEEVIQKHPGKVFYDLGYGSDNERKIGGAIPLKIKLDEVISFCEYAGTVIARRSGIVDMLASAKVRLYSLYPTNLTYEDYQKVDEHCISTKQYLEIMDMAPKGFEKRIHISSVEKTEVSSRHLISQMEMLW